MITLPVPLYRPELRTLEHDVRTMETAEVISSERSVGQRVAKCKSNKDDKEEI
jgi:hypothetical protein